VAERQAAVRAGATQTARELTLACQATFHHTLSSSFSLGIARHMSGERVERRLTAILAADVAGYSRLMGADEEGALARLKAHRRELIDPKIESKGLHLPINS
jgi:class 3 adenylate cyclase